MYKNVDKALCKQLIGAFDDVYFLTLYNQATRCKNIAVINLLHHIYTNYSDLDSTVIRDNNMTVQEDLDASQHIGKYITKVENCIDIARAADTMITTSQQLLIAFDAMYHKGLYNEACLRWEDKQPVNKTWPNWKYISPKQCTANIALSNH
eukprot:14594076-Ditylum_brightwellii.AAC.1